MQGLISRVLAGGALGCTALLLVNLVFPVPFWERLYKGDERWGTVFLMAEIGLPAAFAFGAVVGLVWRRSRPFCLSPAGLIGCCLAVALVSAMLRPVVARVRTGGRGPLFEVVPDTMVAVSCLAALAIVVMGAVWHIGLRSHVPHAGEACASPETPDAEPGAAADGGA